MTTEYDRLGGGHPRRQLAVVGGGLAHPDQRQVGFWDDFQAQPEPVADFVNILEYLRIALKYKWVIAACVAAALAVGFAVTALTKPIYTAATTIQIDREAPKVVNLAGADTGNDLERSEEFFQTQYGLLKSRSLAERVAQSLALTGNGDFLKTMGAASGRRTSADTTASTRQAQVVGLLQENMGVTPVRESRLVKLTFDSPDRGVSAKIANAFADNYIASNLERKYDASSYARQFLEQRIAQLKTKLEDSEKQLVDYATREKIITLTEGGGSKDQPAPQQSLDAMNLGALDADLTTAKANLIQAQERWKAAQTNTGLGVPEILADPAVQALRQTRAGLNAQYQNQLKTYKPDYPDMLQLKGQIDEIDRQLKTAAETIRSSLRVQYETARKQEGALEAKVNGLKGSVLDLRTREIKYNILQREVDTNRTLYDGLLQRYKEIGVAGGLSDNNISIVDRALPPGAPSKPKPVRNLAIAGVSGLGLGVALSLLLEALDQIIRKPSDVETKLGLPVLGAVPLLDRGVPPSEALADAKSGFSEAYSSIRSTLSFSTSAGAPRILAVTSALPEEGKSTTAIALAQGFARIGARSLLLDLDLRNPSVHKLLGADNRVGMSNLLTSTADMVDAVQASSSQNLFVIPSGPLPPTPVELLAGPRLRTLVDESAEQFEMVILDAPPVMGLADAPLVASIALGTVLVIEAGHTTRAQAQSAIRRLKMANAHLLGVVLTKFDARKSSPGYGYGYGYSYDYDYGAKKRNRKGERQIAMASRRDDGPASAA